jgi:hypothetical protein
MKESQKGISKTNEWNLSDNSLRKNKKKCCPQTSVAFWLHQLALEEQYKKVTISKYLLSFENLLTFPPFKFVFFRSHNKN